MKGFASFCLWTLLICSADCFGKEGKLVFPAKLNTNSAPVELKGHLVPSSRPLQFRTESGGVYTLVSNRISAALFVETNLQATTLLLKGKVLPQRRFEVTGNLHSVRDGKVQELYYYCDVCAIKGIDPGPCMCCQEPVHLVEKPVK